MRLAVIALTVVGARAAAAGDEMVADRHGFGEYGASVGEGLRPLHRIDHGFFPGVGFSRRF